jgi:purine-cytosine permease-like protein
VWDFTETKPFGAACVGLAVLGISYIAGADRWLLVVLPLLVMLIYYVVIRDGRH